MLPHGDLPSLWLWRITPEHALPRVLLGKTRFLTIPTNGRRRGRDGKIICSALEGTGASVIVSDRNANRRGPEPYQQDALVPNNVITASGFLPPPRAEGGRCCGAQRSPLPPSRGREGGESAGPRGLPAPAELTAGEGGGRAAASPPALRMPGARTCSLAARRGLPWAVGAEGLAEPP